LKLSQEGGGASSSLRSNSVISDNEYHYISGTRNNQTGETHLFIDGDLEDSSNSSSNVYSITNTSQLFLGAINSGGNNLNGILDGVQIWNRVLTQSEIQQYMNCPPTGNEAGLVGYWNFEEGSGTMALDQTSNGNDGTINGATYSTDVPAQTCLGCTATDSVYVDVLDATIVQNDTAICFGDSVTLSAGGVSQVERCDLPSNLQNGLVGYWPFCGNAIDESGNGNNGTVNGATLTNDRFGNVNSAYDFDGVDDFIEVNDSPDLQISNTNFALSAWVKMENYSTNFQSMVLSKRSAQSGANGYAFIVKGDIASPPGYVSFEASGSTDPESHTNNGISLGDWNHIFVNYDLATSEISTYINGVLDSITSGILSPNPVTPNLFIGKDGLLNNYFLEGYIDDIGIWNRALTISEIQQLYELGNYDITWSTGDTTATISVSPAQTTTYTVTVDNGISTCTDSVTVTVNAASVDLGPDTLSLCAGDSVLLDAGAGYDQYIWSTGDTMQSIDVDSSGMYSVTVGNSIGVANNYSLSFDGNNFNSNDGRVEFGNVNLGNNFTICFWAKDSSHLNAYFHELVNINGDFTTGFYSDTSFGVNISSGGMNNNWALAGAITSSPTTISSFSIWNNFAVTYDNDSLFVYLNGQKESQYHAPGYSLNGYLLLGDRNMSSSGNYNHNGKMDELSVWNIVLDQEQIQQYMGCPPTGNETGLVGYWDFEEGSGSLANNVNIRISPA
jgi:hypothetical protein